MGRHKEKSELALISLAEAIFYSISLSKGLVAIIDICDEAVVSPYKWYADCGPWTIYAKTDHLPKRPRLHVHIMQPPNGLIVHHRNANGLHNYRTNLQVTTYSVNAQRSALRYNKDGSKYRGVSLHKSGRFSAEITLNYKKTYIGLFITEQDAAEAYNKAALELFGPEAILNVVKHAQTT